MEKLYICTIATSRYNIYFEYLFESLKHFILKKFELHLIIISDIKHDFIDIPKHILSVQQYPIAHFPYPFNPYLKVFIIDNALSWLNISENDYMIYIDVDTIFRKCDNYDNIENLLLQNKILVMINVFFKHQYYDYENSLCKNHYPEVYIQNLRREDWIQSSFFGGRILEYKNFVNKCFNLTLTFTKDWKNKRIPPLIDQSIINKIVIDNPDLFIKDFFATRIWTINKDEIHNDFNDSTILCDPNDYVKNYPNIFLIQKFNQDIKNNIRYSI